MMIDDFFMAFAPLKGRELKPDTVIRTYPNLGVRHLVWVLGAHPR